VVYFDEIMELVALAAAAGALLLRFLAIMVGVYAELVYWKRNGVMIKRQLQEMMHKHSD